MTRARNTRKAFSAVLTVGIVSICGFIGMLLADGVLDGMFFLLALLPLGLGSVNFLLQRRGRISEP